MEFWGGFAVGFITPLFGVAVLFEIFPALYQLELIDYRATRFLLLRVGTFGLILNAGIFALALNFNKEKVAYGILNACVIYVIALFVFWLWPSSV